MLRIGNDIVDLKLAKTQSNWQRNGFLEKQFTFKEQTEIHNAKNPFLKVWLFWSMKEAAYKCYTQEVEKRFFAPLKFNCSTISKDTGFVDFEGLVFYTTSTTTANYVHTIANNKQKEVVFFTGIEAPLNINIALIKRLSMATDVSQNLIKKKKTEIGAPLFYNGNKRLTKSCSISHHGDYAAFVFTLEN